ELPRPQGRRERAEEEGGGLDRPLAVGAGGDDLAVERAERERLARLDRLEALPAGEHAGIVSAVSELGDRLLDGADGDALERRRLHWSGTASMPRAAGRTSSANRSTISSSSSIVPERTSKGTVTCE